MEREQLVKMKDIFKTLAETSEELISMYDKEEAGEDVDSKKMEAAVGRYMISLMEMQALSNG
ncbi:hypothetical protein [Romboutsia ilealis]|uniref:hypothetical protein n=1 Tax=Romboutsia ilealis TaxID=1115758 RepID=UPI0025737718|nr:hypothetical protein [Romboutsia ilealis]